MKKFFKVLALAFCVLMAVTALAACGNAKLDAANDRITELEALLEAEKNNPHPEQFAQWFIESENWRAVNRGYFSQDPNDKISDEELIECLTMAYKMQFAGNTQFPYFVVFSSDEAKAWLQTQPLDNYWPLKANIHAGTVLVLVFTRTTSSPLWANFDAGAAAGAMDVAIWSKGYRTHWFCDLNFDKYASETSKGPWENPAELILFGKGYTWTNSSLTEQGVEKSTWKLMHGVVIGKIAPLDPAAETDTRATAGNRGDNWVFWAP